MAPWSVILAVKSFRGHFWGHCLANELQDRCSTIDLLICSIPAPAPIKRFMLSRQWTMSIYDWKAVLSRFAIQFEERTEQLPTQTPFTQNSGCPLLWIMWSVRDGVEPNRF